MIMSDVKSMSDAYDTPFNGKGRRVLFLDRDGVVLVEHISRVSGPYLSPSVRADMVH